jgi:hypothetical protein
MKDVRNFGILAVIALAIVAIPTAGRIADLVNALLSLILAGLIAFFVARLYRERRIDVYGLGELDRGILYASLAGIVVVLAGAQNFDTTAGALVLLALLAACGAGLIRVYQAWRSY